MIVARSIFILTILTTNDHISGLIELPSIQDNDIVATETAIRDTTNKLFEHLQLQPSKTQDKRLKQFSAVHNYLVSLTVKDYDNLKEIATLARVDNGNDKAEQFIGVINDILNEIPEEPTKTSVEEVDVDRDVIDTIDAFLNNLNFLKNSHELNKGATDLNKELFQYLEDQPNFESNSDLFANLTFNESDSEEDNTTAAVDDEGEFWQPSGRRIFKGERTKIKYFPFMASVAVFGQFQCAGSIVKSDLVITAASCLQLAYNNRFFRENPKFLSVRVGSSWYVGGGEVIPVLEVYFHPGYDPKTLNDNIAIMRLRRWIKFSKHKKRVKKIRLDKYDHALPDSTNGIAIAGWGALSAANIIKDPWSNQLAYTILDVYGLEECKDVYTSTYVNRRHFCAGFMSKGGGACNRDVGGPGIVDGILTGVISFGSPVCGAADTPTVFTKLGFYRDWIEGIMEQHVPAAPAMTTPQNTMRYRYETESWATTKEPKVYPIVSKMRNEWPTWTLSAEETTRGSLSEAEKQRLFEQFLNSVFESQEKQESLKNQGYRSILRLDDKAKGLERQGLHGSKLIGNTQAMDANEPIIQEAKRHTLAKTDDEEDETLPSSPPPIRVPANMVTIEVDMDKNDGRTGFVPNSKELEEKLTQAAENNYKKGSNPDSRGSNTEFEEEVKASEKKDEYFSGSDPDSKEIEEENLIRPVAEKNDVLGYVPDSKELDRDNAQITQEEMKGAALSVEGSGTHESAEEGFSEAGGLSVASFEDLTLRLRNKTETDKIFDIPQQQLYDILSDRMVQVEAPTNVNATETQIQNIQSGAPIVNRADGRIF